MTKVKRGRTKTTSKVEVKRRGLKMRYEPTDPKKWPPISYAGAVDLHNTIIGAGRTFRENPKEGNDLHNSLKWPAKRQAGWAETGGDHKNTVEMLCAETCRQVKQLYGL